MDFFWAVPPSARPRGAPKGIPSTGAGPKRLSGAISGRFNDFRGIYYVELPAGGMKLELRGSPRAGHEKAPGRG